MCKWGYITLLIVVVFPFIFGNGPTLYLIQSRSETWNLKHGRIISLNVWLWSLPFDHLHKNTTISCAQQVGPKSWQVLLPLMSPSLTEVAVIRNTLTLGTSPKLVGSASFTVLKGIMFHICFKLLQYSNNKNKWHTHTKWLKNVWNVFGYTGLLNWFWIKPKASIS